MEAMEARRNNMRRKGGIRFGGRAVARQKYRAKPHWVDVTKPPYALIDHAYLLAECGNDRKAALLEGRRLGWELCASTLEARRYQELLHQRVRGEIRELAAQVPYELSAIRDTGEIVKIGEYVADFVYVDQHSNRIVEDCKGMLTELYRWKHRHMQAEHGIEIQEVRR